MADRFVISPPTQGSPYDNGIYRALTPDLPAATVTDSELPAFCCRIRGHGEGGTECRRTNLVFHLWTDYAQIARERARVRRLRSEWKARNLIGWIEFAERRLRHQMTTWKLPECTGEESRRFTPGEVRDVETALPVCTC